MKSTCKFILMATVISSAQTSFAIDEVTQTGYRTQATPGNSGAGLYADNSPSSVGSYSMTQANRGIDSQKASCQSAVNGFEKQYETCMSNALQNRTNYIARSANNNLPDKQSLFNADVIIADSQLKTDQTICTSNYNNSARNLNASSCGSVMTAPTKALP